MELKRYLEIADDKHSGWNLDEVKKDLAYLVRKAHDSGDYDIQLRHDYFNIYYQGNSLAKVTLEGNGTYTAEIHWKFLPSEEPPKPKFEDDPEVTYSVSGYSSSLKTQVRKMCEEQKDISGLLIGLSKTKAKDDDNRRAIFKGIQQGPPNNSGVKLRQFFQKKYLEKFAKSIREKGGREEEERMFEQAMIAENPPSKDFIIIDRQVSIEESEESEEAEAKKKLKKMDVLALKRDHNAEYHFVVIEVKLGNNPDLAVDSKEKAKVVEQLTEYVNTVRKKIGEFADCYEKNYRQKVELGILKGSNDPPLKIDRNPETVQGLVVVIGYPRLADKHIHKLDGLLKAKGLRPVCQIRNEPKLATRC